jgi:hypothetical protein
MADSANPQIQADVSYRIVGLDGSARHTAQDRRKSKAARTPKIPQAPILGNARG